MCALYILTHSMRQSLPWYPNQTKILQKKKITGKYHWWTQTKKKIFNKILADQIHNTLKESYTMIKWDLSQEWKDFSVSSSQSVIQCINKLKNKNHMIISINAYKAFDKIHHPFMIKTLEEVGREGTYVNTIKATYDKPIVNVMLNSEKLMYSIVYSDVQFGLLIKSF